MPGDEVVFDSSKNGELEEDVIVKELYIGAPIQWASRI